MIKYGKGVLYQLRVRGTLHIRCVIRDYSLVVVHVLQKQTI